MNDRRATLLSKAEQLIRTRGYAGFSYADLSAAVGITKAAIHYHFPTKENLVSSAIEEYRARYAEAFRRIEADHPHALDRIDAYGRLYLAGLDQGVGCLCAALAVEHDVLPEVLKTATASFFAQHLARLEQIYVDGLARKQVSAALTGREAARMILATLEGALLIERLLGERKGFEVALRALGKSLAPPS